ncbi:unnamed protein product [Lota lota]
MLFLFLGNFCKGETLVVVTSRSLRLHRGSMAEIEDCGLCMDLLSAGPVPSPAVTDGPLDERSASRPGSQAGVKCYLPPGSPL